MVYCYFAGDVLFFAEHLYYLIEIKTRITTWLFPSGLGSGVPLRFRQRPVKTGSDLAFAINGIDGHTRSDSSGSGLYSLCVCAVERGAACGIDGERSE